ncbi:MAG: hypothetical protein QXZ44_06935 [Ferroplasma sp.]
MKYKLIIAILVVSVMIVSMMALSIDSSAASAPANNNDYMGHSTINSTLGAHFHGMHNYMKVTYNSATGLISGKYINATFKNGVFSNVTYNATSTQLISSMYANSSDYGIIMPFSLSSLLFNGSFTFGDMFLYMNSTTYMAIHNNPALETNILVHDGELHINLPGSAKIEYDTTHNIQVNTSADASFNSNINLTSNNGLFGSASMSSKYMFDFNNTIYASRSMIIVDNNGTTYMLFIHNGSFSIKGQNITVQSKGTAMVSMVVPPGMQHFPKSGMVISNIMKGIISSEIALNDVNSTVVNSTINFNSSLMFKFTGNTTTTESFNVNSSINHHTIVAIYISDSVMKYTGHEYVKFDGKASTLVSLSTLVNETSTAHSYYAYDNTSSGAYVFVYVPHFSDHTIEVSDKPFAPNYIEYIAIGGIVAAIVLVSLATIMIQKKKRAK